MIVVQLFIYLLVFTIMVKIAVRDNALNGIYFYPKEVQKRAVEIGLIDESTINKKMKRFAFRAAFTSAPKVSKPGQSSIFAI